MAQTAYDNPPGDESAAPTVVFTLPLVCFIGALATDVTYWHTSEIQWSNFSAWLLMIGMVLGVVYVLFALIISFRSARPVRSTSGLWNIVLIVIALAFAIANNFVHGRDGWTAVVPMGIILSSITVLIFILAAIMGTRSYPARQGDLA